MAAILAAAMDRADAPLLVGGVKDQDYDGRIQRQEGRPLVIRGFPHGLFYGIIRGRRQLYEIVIAKVDMEEP